MQAVQTIAAGDTFNGALITALLEEKTLPEAIRSAHEPCRHCRNT
ncbi:PfkB family carbohydrate kinase [Shigella flexneri]